MNNNDKFQTTFVYCSDATWSNFYDSLGHAFTRLDSVLQLRGYDKPFVQIHEDDLSTIEGSEDMDLALTTLAELFHIHLEYAHIEDSLVGEGEEVCINKFFPSEI